MSQSTMRKGAILGVLIGMSLLSAPVFSSAEEVEPASRQRVELSLRSWMFTNGETKWSHDASGLDSRLGNPTSKLTYKDSNTQIMELGAKINLSRRWFLRGEVGFSVDFDRGNLIDDDYSAGQHLFSRTTSNITGNGTWYVNGDAGYRAIQFPNDRGQLNVLGGFQYWQTTYEATGFTRLVCDPAVTTCTPPSSSAPAIKNTTHWITPIHVGIDTEYFLVRRVAVGLKASVSPISILYNEDSHLQRPDLQRNPSFSMWGVGVSANVEPILRVILNRYFSLTAGYRVWWNRTYAGTWENHPVGSASDTAPLREFQTIRHGATVGLTAAF